jgi:hypothetical protein
MISVMTSSAVFNLHSPDEVGRHDPAAQQQADVLEVALTDLSQMNAPWGLGSGFRS